MCSSQDRRQWSLCLCSYGLISSKKPHHYKPSTTYTHIIGNLSKKTPNNPVLTEHMLIGIKDWSLIPVAISVYSVMYESTYKALFTVWQIIYEFLNKDPEIKIKHKQNPVVSTRPSRVINNNNKISAIMQNDVHHLDTVNPSGSSMIVKCSLISNCKPEGGLYPKDVQRMLQKLEKALRMIADKTC